MNQKIDKYDKYYLKYQALKYDMENNGLLIPHKLLEYNKLKERFKNNG